MFGYGEEPPSSGFLNQVDNLIANTSGKLAGANREKETSGMHMKIIRLVGVVFLCDNLLLTMVVPILPIVFKDTPFADPFTLALAFASKPISQILVNPCAGTVVDKYGPRRPLLVGSVVCLLATGVIVFSLFGISTASLGSSTPQNDTSRFISVVVARIVQGIASAFTNSSGFTLIVQTHHVDVRGSAVGIASIGIALGTRLCYCWRLDRGRDRFEGAIVHCFVIRGTDRSCCCCCCCCCLFVSLEHRCLVGAPRGWPVGKRATLVAVWRVVVVAGRQHCDATLHARQKHSTPVRSRKTIRVYRICRFTSDTEHIFSFSLAFSFHQVPFEPFGGRKLGRGIVVVGIGQRRAVPVRRGGRGFHFGAGGGERQFRHQGWHVYRVSFVARPDDLCCKWGGWGGCGWLWVV